MTRSESIMSDSIMTENRCEPATSMSGHIPDEDLKDTAKFTVRTRKYRRASEILEASQTAKGPQEVRNNNSTTVRIRGSD